MTSPEGALFARLRESCAADWRAYVEHDFVRGIADGTLPEASFRHYLVQDYLFLRHFARAYALAAFKADTLEDMRSAAAALSALVGAEMGLHVTYCRGWGLDEAAMAATPESAACVSYTRYVLDRGMAGDLLDLLAALAPCVMGYGEIGKRLMAGHAVRRGANPYAAWIETYGGDGYQDLCAAAAAQLDAVALRRCGPGILEGRGPRWDSLAATFAAATRLEAAFWQMGLDRSP
ncbi:MAG: thiaminase II [Alphaproteobacteria bacterium]|nr:thiaminase II [Alphaproteobacteria bacterium]